MAESFVTVFEQFGPGGKQTVFILNCFQHNGKKRSIFRNAAANPERDTVVNQLLIPCQQSGKQHSVIHFLLFFGQTMKRPVETGLQTAENRREARHIAGSIGGSCLLVRLHNSSGKNTGCHPHADRKRQ